MTRPVPQKPLCDVRDAGYVQSLTPGPGGS